MSEYRREMNALADALDACDSGLIPDRLRHAVSARARRPTVLERLVDLPEHDGPDGVVCYETSDPDTTPGC